MGRIKSLTFILHVSTSFDIPADVKLMTREEMEEFDSKRERFLYYEAMDDGFEPTAECIGYWWTSDDYLELRYIDNNCKIQIIKDEYSVNDADEPIIFKNCEECGQEHYTNDSCW